MQREEYPRPQFVRDRFMVINGTWEFGYDDAGVSLEEGWYQPGKALPMQIEVPFVYECAMSGIGCHEEQHDTVFYKRRFTAGGLVEGPGSCCTSGRSITAPGCMSTAPIWVRMRVGIPPSPSISPTLL